MATESVYSYKIEMAYINGSTEESIVPEMICQLIISYNYNDILNAPIIYTQLKLPIRIYNIMQKNIEKGKLKLIIKKFDTKKKNPVKKVYIQKQFSYFFANDDYDMDSETVKDDNDKAYRTTYLGLIDMSLINDNKKVYNKLFVNTNTFTIIHYFIKGKIVMEPFDKNDVHDYMYIPPLTSFRAVLEYLNKITGFYKTNYRYFKDFNRSYLLSDKGKGIDIGDGKYKSVHFDVQNQSGNDNKANLQGFVTDSKNKCYIVQLNDSGFDIKIDKTTDNIINRYIGVKYKGGTTNEDLKLVKMNDHSVKPKLIRIFNNNNMYLKTISSILNTNDTIINISKADLDCTIIEPHKEFIFNNTEAYKDRNGKYLLDSKNEIFTAEGDSFKCVVTATFKRCK